MLGPFVLLALALFFQALAAFPRSAANSNKATHPALQHNPIMKPSPPHPWCKEKLAAQHEQPTATKSQI